jgi:glycerol-3-phosphate acyltransferase PlsY
VLGWVTAIVAVVIWRHRGNLARLARGEEPKFGRKAAA